MTKIQRTLIWLSLAAIGCGSRTSTNGGRDASTVKDSTPASDQAAQVEALADTPLISDLASNRDSSGPDAVDAPTMDAKGADAAQDVRDASIPDRQPIGNDSARDVSATESANDMAQPTDLMPLSIDGPHANFCKGDFSHMLFNGDDSTPGVSNKMLALDCCDAGEIVVVTATTIHMVYIAWRRESIAGLGIPATIDLANPPSGWSVQVFVDCDPLKASCSPPPDSYTTGLVGTLQISTGSSGLVMSLCLHVEEPPSSPHPILHTLDLYAPNIRSS
jgi:hypothetical protein